MSVRATAVRRGRSDRSRRLLRVALAASVVGLIAANGTPAHAAAYRYWSYWLGDAAGWTYSNAGPAYRIPADGTVEGWRFAVAVEGGGATPLIAPDFETICGGTPAEEGRKRVAVIVDPGAAEDAPDGATPPGAWALCVVAAPKATGYDVLRAAASVRVEGGLVCAIHGYPDGECAVVVDEPDPTPEPSPSPKPQPTKTKEPKPAPTAAPSPTRSPSSDAPVTSDTVDPSPTPTPSQQPSASTTPSPTPVPTPSASPAPTTSDSAEPAVVTPSASPSPSVSMLAEPLPDDGQAQGGSALITGGAVMGIALLGAAAVVITRRRTL